MTVHLDRQFLALHAQIQVWAEGTERFPEWDDGHDSYSRTASAVAIAVDVTADDSVRVRITDDVSTVGGSTLVGRFTLTDGTGGSRFVVGNVLAADIAPCTTAGNELEFQLFLDEVGPEGARDIILVVDEGAILDVA